MFIRGIKQRLFLQFWILFFLAMLFVDVLMLFIFLEQTISQKIERNRMVLKEICEETVHSGSYLGHQQTKPVWPTGIDGKQKFIYLKAPVTDRIVSNRQGKETDLPRLVSQTLQLGSGMIKKHGIIIGLLFFQPEFVTITYPVQMQGKTIAAGGLEINLIAEYREVNRIQKVAVLFVVVNSLFMALIGNHQLSRFYFRPLKRLAKRAETFRDEDNLFFAVRKEDNEFSVLSSSLNKMLNRIADDKKMLKDTIGSLQDANQKLTKAQNDVIRAEKMATVGRLTSGIAHEIGNPIGIVLGYLDLMKQNDLSEGERTDFIERSEKEIMRISHIIRQLLDMSRSSAGEAKPIGIHQLLDDLVSVFHFQPTASHIRFQSTLNAVNDCVFADPDQLRQVFLNMLLNAVDAVNSSATADAVIKVSTEPSTIGANPSSQADKPAIKVTMQDNGPGIDSSSLPHVFDPFFTTKPPGKGTGLGLSVSFMIVERLGGRITAEQHREGGATFHVVIPSFIESHDNASSG